LPEQLNSYCLLSHRVVCNGVFTTDVWVLLLRKVSSPDFKYSIISLWNYPLLTSFASRQPFWTCASLLNSSQTPSFFNIFLKVTICLTETIFDNSTQMMFYFLIKNICYYIGTCFQRLLSDRLCPEYKLVLTKRKSPLKKDPIPLPLCILKLALLTGPISPPPLWVTCTVYIDPL